MILAVDDVTPFKVAVTVVVAGDVLLVITPVTTPVELILTIAEDAGFQVTCALMSEVLPSAYFPIAVNLTV